MKSLVFPQIIYDVIVWRHIC